MRALAGRGAGRADQAAIDLASRFPRVSLLAKPFTVDELRDRLSR